MLLSVTSRCNGVSTTAPWSLQPESDMVKKLSLLTGLLLCAQAGLAQTPAPAMSAASAAVLASKAAADAAAALEKAQQALAAAKQESDAKAKAANEAAAAAATAVAAAAAPAASTPDFSVKYVTQVASDAENYLGDRIKFSVTVHAKRVHVGSSTLAPTDVCIPAGSSLRGQGKMTAREGADEVTYDVFSLGAVESGEPECAKSPPSTNRQEKAACQAAIQQAADALKQACNDVAVVAMTDTVAIRAAVLKKTPPNRHGWAFGTLLVPFKYQLRGDRSTSGGATLGGYVGYRSALLGTSWQTIVFAGPTKVEVAVTTPAKAATATTPAVEAKTDLQSLAGLSYGAGFLGSIKESFKWGLVFGADQVSRSANYVNNGKLWISLSLGYEFF
jgi:hypothetical protein